MLAELAVDLTDIDVEVNRPTGSDYNQLVYVNTPAFDRAWQDEEPRGFYIGKGGSNGIPGRYERFDKFIHATQTMTASEVHVDIDGRVGFLNGRHRYAWLRDNGALKIPIAMNRDSVKNAKRFGYLAEMAESLADLNEDVQMAVASSNLQSFRYDETTNTLTVRFRSGGVYRYDDVPPDVVDEMRWADSRGRYFWRFIRMSYSYTMLTAPRPGFTHAFNTSPKSVAQRHLLKTPKFTHKLPRVR